MRNNKYIKMEHFNGTANVFAIIILLFYVFTVTGYTISSSMSYSTTASYNAENLQVQTIDSTSQLVSWSAPRNPPIDSNNQNCDVQYQLESQRQDQTQNTPNNVYTACETQYTMTNLSPSTGYRYRVRSMQGRIILGITDWTPFYSTADNGSNVKIIILATVASVIAFIVVIFIFVIIFCPPVRACLRGACCPKQKPNDASVTPSPGLNIRRGTVIGPGSRPNANENTYLSRTRGATAENQSNFNHVYLGEETDVYANAYD